MSMIHGLGNAGGIPEDSSKTWESNMSQYFATVSENIGMMKDDPQYFTAYKQLQDAGQLQSIEAFAQASGASASSPIMLAIQSLSQGFKDIQNDTSFSQVSPQLYQQMEADANTIATDGAKITFTQSEFNKGMYNAVSSGLTLVQNYINNPPSTAKDAFKEIASMSGLYTALMNISIFNGPNGSITQPQLNDIDGNFAGALASPTNANFYLESIVSDSQALLKEYS